jgi:ribonuclease P protein component
LIIEGGKGSARFPRRIRLLGSRDYKRVFDQAFRSSDNCFTLLARKNQLEYPRLGLAIAKKLVKSAVARNRIKRLIRESYRINQQKLTGLDIVVLGRSGIEGKSNKELHESLEQHWSRLIQKCENS